MGPPSSPGCSLLPRGDPGNIQNIQVLWLHGYTEALVPYVCRRGFFRVQGLGLNVFVVYG